MKAALGRFNFIQVLLWALISLVPSCKDYSPILEYSKTLIAEKDYHVILFAGQSNMVGLGEIKVLDDRGLADNITYYNFGMDTNLKTLHTTFGPEVGVSRILSEQFPELNFVLIKYAVGGSSIEDWLPKGETKQNKDLKFGNLYENLLDTVAGITKNYNTKIIAFLWMQGETDARQHISNSQNYENNFTKFIGSIRKDLGNDQLPFIYGKVNSPREDGNGIDFIRLAQENIDAKVPNAFLINTDDLPKFKDSLHYSSDGLLCLGDRFGNKIIEIINED